MFDYAESWAIILASFTIEESRVHFSLDCIDKSRISPKQFWLLDLIHLEWLFHKQHLEDSCHAVQAMYSA